MIVQRLTARRLVDMLGDWRGAGHGYRELADGIEILVRDGAITPGTALPAERPLSETLGVSRTTVSAAYQRLREGGWALSRQGSGTVVRTARPADRDEAAGGGAATLDLSTACPEPWGGLAELSARALAERPDAFRLTGYDTLGDPDLRVAIAERYTGRGLPTAPDQIMVTLGAQHAIFLIARTMLRRGDRSLIESPSYPHAREALAATGALVAELPVGLDGYDSVAMLDIARRTSPRLVYLIPDHHNPTGMSMPDGLRTRLIDALTAQGSYIIADETTAELVLHEPRTVRPFAAAAEHAHQDDHIITVGSMGKTVWGGLRVGWIRASPEVIGRLEVARRISDLGTGTWEQVIATLALEGYDAILAERGRQLAARHRTLVTQLGERLPEWRLSPALGGASTWVDLGERRSTALSRAVARTGVKLVPGPRFGSPGVFERFVRVPFTLPEPQLAEAVHALATGWEASRNPGPMPASSPLAEPVAI